MFEVKQQDRDGISPRGRFKETNTTNIGLIEKQKTTHFDWIFLPFLLFTEFVFKLDYPYLLNLVITYITAYSFLHFNM